MRILTLAAVAFCAASASAPAQRGYHVDTRHGIKFKPPAKWAWVPGYGDRGATVDQWLAPRSHLPKTATGWAHTPTLRVLFFSKSPVAGAAAIDKGGLPGRSPYRGFGDYLARSHGGAVRVESRDEGKFGKWSGAHYVCRISRATGDLVLETCVFTTPAGELAVEFEVLADWHERLAKDFRKTFGSVAEVEVEASQAPPARPWLSAEWAKRSAQDRAEARREFGRLWMLWRDSRAEPGWKTVASDDYLVLSRADAKFNKRVVAVLAAVRVWIDERFAGLGDEVVMPAAVRIFADRREFAAYQLRETPPLAIREVRPNWWPEPIRYDHDKREILFYASAVGNTGAGFGELLVGVFEHYLHDKLPAAHGQLPRWLQTGLVLYLGSVRVRGGKVMLEPSVAESAHVRARERDGSMPKVWNLVQETVDGAPNYEADEAPWLYGMPCARLLRFIETGRDQAFGADDFLVKYLQGVAIAAQAAPPDPRGLVDVAALTDEQREPFDREFRKRRDAMLAAINKAVVPLSLDQWSAIDKEFSEWSEKLK